MSDIVELKEDVSQSQLYSEDLAPVPVSGRTWSTWNIAAIWIGMAVCIPTYLLAADMIRAGLTWQEALAIIFIANVIVAVPMVYNGHAGVKYGIPFPVLARASFGTWGVHIPSIVRALVACGWFGIQTWIGGKAFYVIYCAITGTEYVDAPNLGNFIGFGLFWCLNLFFIWKGTESIRWLESLAAPLLLLIGIVLIIWGANMAGGFGAVLRQNTQLQNTTAQLVDGPDGAALRFDTLTGLEGRVKAAEFRAGPDKDTLQKAPWDAIPATGFDYPLVQLNMAGDAESAFVQFRRDDAVSSVVEAKRAGPSRARWLLWISMLTAMVGFWATMSISIADITRYAKGQREQMIGQFLGLPGTMFLYSFVGVFVTCAAIVAFGDILIAEDAPWDPVALVARFESPVIVILAQIAMLIATLSTNIAANVIAPANAFANAFPKKITFAMGGLITGIIGILMGPWQLIGMIAGLLLFVSGLLGPVVGVMLSDYWLVRRKQLKLEDLYKSDGIYHYNGGINLKALIALFAGVGLALIGTAVQELRWLYDFSWFIGFAVSFFLYYLLMKDKVEPVTG